MRFSLRVTEPGTYRLDRDSSPTGRINRGERFACSRTEIHLLQIPVAWKGVLAPGKSGHPRGEVILHLDSCGVNQDLAPRYQERAGTHRRRYLARTSSEWA